METMTEHITSSEGAKLLRVSRQMFFYYVKKGRIRKIASEKRGGTLYNRDDIMRLRAELGRDDEPASIVVDWVKTTDLPNTLALDILVYDEPIIGDFNLYFSWLRKNPRITLAAFDGDKRTVVLAYINLLPLPEAAILAILKGERDEKSITAEEIKDFNREGEYILLAESAVTRPGHPEYLGTVLRELTDYWCQQWPQRKLAKIYAQAASDEGLYLIQKMFFAPMLGYPEDAYVLDLGRKNPSRFVREYQACIAARGRRA